MSFNAPPGGGAASYFCHQCNLTVTVIPSPSGDITCSICHGGFVEEVEIPEPAPAPQPSTFLFGSGHPSSFPTVGAVDPFAFFFGPSPFTSASPNMEINSPADIFGLLGLEPSMRGAPHPPAGGPEPFQPLRFLSDYLQTLTAGGANIHFVVEGGSSPGMRPLFSVGGGGGGPATYGDYLVGPGLEQLIQHLMENDPNRYGTPPAAKSVIDGLPDVKISQELLASDEPECAVCKDTFEVGDSAKQMPCKHIYHKDCILPWLELHNSCPVCRFELPTDDPEYENRRQGASSGPTQGGVQPPATGGNAPGVLGAGSGGTYLAGPRVVQRRFTIQLPWPFRSSPNSQDGGNSGGTNRPGDTGGTGNSGGNPGDRNSWDHGHNTS